MLVANGGKTYEELLKTAQEIEKQIAAENAKKIAKTGDTAMAGLYLLLAAASLAGIAMTAKQKKIYLIPWIGHSKREESAVRRFLLAKKTRKYDCAKKLPSLF